MPAGLSHKVRGDTRSPRARGLAALWSRAMMSPKTLLRLATFAVLLALSPALGSATAAAQQTNGRHYVTRPHTGGRPLQLELHAGVSWFGFGLATGMRFGVPLVKNGLMPGLNNAFYLNFGADFYWVECPGYSCNGRNYGAGVGFPVTLHWEFYFSDKLSAFAELGRQVFLHQRFIAGDRFDVYDPGYWIVGAVGGSYRVHQNVALTVRVGVPYTAAGITFLFGG